MRITQKALRLDGLGISQARYRELEWFCYQYPEKRRKAQSLCGLSRGAPPGISRSGDPSDPTVQAVIRRERLLHECEQIERACHIAGECDAIAQFLLQYVTRPDKPPIDFVPCGRRQFFDIRRRFFLVLHQQREAQGR